MPVNLSIGVVMDPIDTIKIKKDSTFAMMLEAQLRGHSLFYILQSDMFVKNGTVFARMFPVSVFDDIDKWYELSDEQVRPLHELSAVLMRKDPPFDMEYIYSTYLLELAEKKGCLIVNKPASIRSANGEITFL